MRPYVGCLSWQDAANARPMWENPGYGVVIHRKPRLTEFSVVVKCERGTP